MSDIVMFVHSMTLSVQLLYTLLPGSPTNDIGCVQHDCSRRYNTVAVARPCQRPTLGYGKKRFPGCQRALDLAPDVLIGPVFQVREA